METVLATFAIKFKKNIYYITMNTLEWENGEWYIVLDGNKVYSEPLHGGKYFPDMQQKAHDLLKNFLKK